MADPSAHSNTSGVQEHAWPVYRNNIVDFLNHSRKRHHISALWEADVTECQARLRSLQRRTRIAISFNAYLVFLLSRATLKHPEIQSVRIPFRRKTACFDGVDVGTAIPGRTPDQRTIALAHTIRNAHAKSLAQICLEMREASNRNAFDHPDIRWRYRLAHYPAWMRRWFWRWVDADPARRRRIRGTIGITNVSFLGDGKHLAFGIPMPLLTTNLCVGAVYEKLEPAPQQPKGFETRKKICLTLQSDHDVVDGAPLGLFVRTFTQSLEQAHGLHDAFADELVSLHASHRTSR